MKYFPRKDRIKRNIYNKKELKLNYINSISNSLNFTPRLRFHSIRSNFLRLGSFVKFRNTCIISSRTTSIYRHFQLSRISLREQANSGQLPGVRRSSW